MQMGLFLIDSRAAPQRRSYARTLAAFVSTCPPAASAATPGSVAVPPGSVTAAVTPPVNAAAATPHTAESPVYMLVLSLLVHSHAEWRAARLQMLRRLCAYWRGAGGVRERFSLAGPASPTTSPAVRPAVRSPGRSPLEYPSAGGASGGLLPPAMSIPVAIGAGEAGGSSGAAAPATPVAPSGPFAEVRPALLLFAVVDKLHSILKEARAFHPRSDASGAAPEGADEWVGLMRERLQRHDQSVLKELTAMLREYEEDLLPAADATEVLDVLGVLAEVLRDAPSADTWLGLA